MGKGTVKESLTIEGEDSPSLRNALEYELNMIESSIEAFENEAEALKALIDWHGSVATDLLSAKDLSIANQMVEDILELSEDNISALYSGDDVCETGTEWAVGKCGEKSISVHVHLNSQNDYMDLQWGKIFKYVGSRIGEYKIKHSVLKWGWKWKQ